MGTVRPRYQSSAPLSEFGPVIRNFRLLRVRGKYLKEKLAFEYLPSTEICQPI